MDVGLARAIMALFLVRNSDAGVISWPAKTRNGSRFDLNKTLKKYSYRGFTALQN